MTASDSCDSCDRCSCGTTTYATSLEVGVVKGTTVGLVASDGGGRTIVAAMGWELSIELAHTLLAAAVAATAGPGAPTAEQVVEASARYKDEAIAAHHAANHHHANE